MVFHRVLSLRRSSRSADGRVEKQSTNDNNNNEDNTDKIFTRKGKVTAESPVSTRTEVTCSPELSHATSDDISHQLTPKSPLRRKTGSSDFENNLRAPASADKTRGCMPPRRPSSANSSHCSHRSSDDDQDKTWMRILPFEEKKEYEDDQRHDGIGARKCRNSTNKKVPAIIHAGGLMSPAAVTQSPLGNHFQEYEE